MSATVQDANVTTTMKRGPGRPLGSTNKARRLDDDDLPCTPYALGELIGYLPQHDLRLRDFEFDLHIKLNRDLSGSNPRWEESELLTAGLDTVRVMSDFQLCDTKADGTPQYLKVGDPREAQFLVVSFQHKLDATYIKKVTVVLERGAAANPKLKANSVSINGEPTSVAFPAYFSPSFVSYNGKKYTSVDYDSAVYACLKIAQRYMFNVSMRTQAISEVVQGTMVKWFLSATGEVKKERWIRVTSRSGLRIGGGNGNAYDSDLQKRCYCLALGMAALATNTLEGTPYLHDALIASLNAGVVFGTEKVSLPVALSASIGKSDSSAKEAAFVPSVIHTANGPSSIPVRVRRDIRGRSIEVPVVLDIGQGQGKFILREGDDVYLTVHASAAPDDKISAAMLAFLTDNIDTVKTTYAIWEEDYPLDDARGMAQRRAMRSVVLAHAMTIPFSQAILCADAMLTRPAGKCVLAHINEQVPCVKGSEQQFAREQLFLLWEIGSIAMNTADNKSTKLVLFVGGPGGGKTEMVKNLTRWAGDFGKPLSNLLQFKYTSDKPRPEVATMDGAHVEVFFRRTFLAADELSYTESGDIKFDDGALTCPKDPKISALLGSEQCLTETLRLMAMTHQDNARFDAPSSQWTVVSPTIIHAPIRQEFRWGAAAKHASNKRKSTFFRAFTKAFEFDANLFGDDGRGWTQEMHDKVEYLPLTSVKPMWNDKLELDGVKDLKRTNVMGKDEKKRFQKCWQDDIDAIAAWCMDESPSLPASFSLPKEVIVDTGKRKVGKSVYEIRLYGFVPRKTEDDEACGAGAPAGDV